MKTWRVLFVVIMLATCSGFVAQAQEMKAVQSQQPGKEKIKKDELPAAAIKSLEGDYKGWLFVQAYRVKAKDAQGKEISEFEVELKKNELIQTFKFDKNGNSKKT